MKKLHKTYFLYAFFVLSMLPSFVYAMEPSVEQQLTQEEQNKINRQLFKAVRNGELQKVREALDAGAEVDTVWIGGTPLSFAADKGHRDIVELLLGQGAKVNAPVTRSALYRAASRGHEEIVRMLLDAGAVVNMVGEMTPLIAATENGHAKVVKLLLAQDARVSMRVQGAYGWALCQAVLYGHADIIKLLLDAGVDVMASDGGSMTPLMMFAARADVVNTLLTYIPQPEREAIQQRMLTFMLALLRAQPKEGQKGTIQLPKDMRRLIAQMALNVIVAERMTQLKEQLVQQKNNGLMAVKLAIWLKHIELVKLRNLNMIDESVKKLRNQIENNVRQAVFPKIEDKANQNENEVE